MDIRKAQYIKKDDLKRYKWNDAEKFAPILKAAATLNIDEVMLIDIKSGWHIRRVKRFFQEKKQTKFHIGQRKIDGKLKMVIYRK